jgi:AraC-like DNA-binding protein
MPASAYRPAERLQPFRASSRALALGDTDPFTPTPERAVRTRARSLPVDVHFEPHRHPWAQLAYCASGLIQLSVQTAVPRAGAAANGAGAAANETTYIVPPSRAVWIAPGVQHAINVLEAAEMRTLYIDASATSAGWQDSRVIVVSALLRELILALDAPPGLPLAPLREERLAGLVLDEIAHASIQTLGVPLPHAERGDKRLRHLCESVLRAPGERATLAEWLTDVGASERTMARLFRDELGLSYQQWRQQAILAHALPLLARGTPVSQVAAATGYASDSAFTAMFKAAMGQPPSHFQNKAHA